MLPALVTDSLEAYRAAFIAEVALVGALAVLAFDGALRSNGRAGRGRLVVLAVVAVVPVLLGGVILTRFDLVPAALVAAAAAHLFNLLDARGAVSVTERTSYLGRLRAIAREVAEGYLRQREALGYPLLARARA